VPHFHYPLNSHWLSYAHHYLDEIVTIMTSPLTTTIIGDKELIHSENYRAFHSKYDHFGGYNLKVTSKLFRITL
jgi:hypothetical protein